MGDQLDHITEADIQARCSQASFEIFPMNIPYDFAVAYRDLALDHLEEHANAIESEVRDMLRGDWAPEMLGIEEPLMEIWTALGL